MRWGTALIGVILVVTIGPAAHGSTQSFAGKLVFAGDRLMSRGDDSQDGLFVANADGTGLTHITHAYDDEEPHWSPDGRAIAFVRSTLSGRGDPIVVVNADGTNARTVGAGVPYGGNDFSSGDPWSPDGSRLAWLGCRGVCVADLRTGATRRVVFTTEDGGASYCWSPDGASLAVVDGAGRLLVVPAAGGAARPVATGATDIPSWSPDGSTIAFVADAKLEIVAAAGGTPRILATDALEESEWSPDGRSLLYLAKGQDGVAIAVVDPATGARRTVTRVSDTARPVWSPDGTAIAYTRPRFPDEAAEADVWVVRADGTGAHAVTQAYPTGAEYAALDTLDWGPGAVASTQPPPKGTFSPQPGATQPTEWVDALGRGPTPDSVAFARGILCDLDAETTTTLVTTWRLSVPTSPVEGAPCGNISDVLDFAVTPSLVAWHGRLLVSLQEDERSFVGAAPLGAPPEHEARRWLGFVEDELGHAPYIGPLLGDGTTISFETYNDTFEKRRLVIFHRRLYRLVGSARPRAVRTPLPADATDALDAEGGRLLLGATHGRLLVIRAVGGGIVARIPAHDPSSARIGGDLVGAISGASLDVYDVHGAHTARFPMAADTGPVRLLAIRGDYAVYVSGIAVHLLRLHDGLDRTLDLPGQAGPVDAVLTAAGLFVGYDEAYAAPAGHVVFFPLESLG